jgi:hypothetical protein
LAVVFSLEEVLEVFLRVCDFDFFHHLGSLFMLRRCLVEMRDGVGNSPEKMREYERAGHLARDIVNSRLKKIVSIASASAQSESGLRNLAGEERLLYEKLFRVINQWKTLILEHKEGT